MGGVRGDWSAPIKRSLRATQEDLRQLNELLDERDVEIGLLRTRLEEFDDVRSMQASKLEDHDVLLAEAAEVLRAVKRILFTRYSDEDKAMEIAADWWEDRAKPLLDKLGERE